MQKLEYDPTKQKKRWVVHFDLLGTSKRIQNGEIEPVFNAYAIACQKLIGFQTGRPSVVPVWFSDTFLLYTTDDSAQSFTAIDLVARWFIFALIQTQIPVRGSMAFGELYADSQNGVYLGTALVEAY